MLLVIPDILGPSSACLTCKLLEVQIVDLTEAFIFIVCAEKVLVQVESTTKGHHNGNFSIYVGLCCFI